jgi:RNA-directed DNA polymerase
MVPIRGVHPGQDREAKPVQGRGVGRWIRGVNMVQNRPTVQELYEVRGVHAEAEVWTPRMLVALVNGVKGGKWFSLIDKVYRPETLEKAWEGVRRNGGASGVDKVGVKRFEAGKDRYLKELGDDLKSGSYSPRPVRRVEIPKGKGQTRPLGIPTVKDRLVQKAVQMVIEPIFESQFLDMNYGFRPGRGAKDALKRVDELIGSGYTHVVDADIKGYFDNIPHDKLLMRVKGSIADGKVLGLIESWLNQDIISELETWKPTVGTPQGAVISPLLANIYLHPLDCLMIQSGYKMVRFADDFVILCESADKAKEAFELITKWIGENGLTLHPDKIHIGDCTIVGQGFDFLGYHFEAGKRDIREKSFTKLKDKIRAFTRRSNKDSIDDIIIKLNKSLNGWFKYFKHIRHERFKAIDGFIRRRMRAILAKRNGMKPFGRSYAIHKRWPNKFFTKLGYITLESMIKIALKEHNTNKRRPRLF